MPSSSPGPGRARPRRWRPGSCGWSRTGWSRRTRCSGSTFTRKAAAELGSGSAIALRSGAAMVERAAPDDARLLGELLARRADGADVLRVRRAAGRRARAAARREPSPGCSRRRCAGSSRTRSCAATTASCRVDIGALASVIQYVLALDGPAAPTTSSTPDDVAAVAAAALGRVGRAAPGGDAVAPRRADRRLRQDGALPARARPAASTRSPRAKRGRRASTTATRWRSRPGSRQLPEVAAGERARYAAVLLDEYQDTGHAQVALLASLFGGGHPVTAVGDPHQSIYGWRGAAAGNIGRFATDVPRTPMAPPAVDLPTGHQLAQRRAHPGAPPT